MRLLPLIGLLGCSEKEQDSASKDTANESSSGMPPETSVDEPEEPEEEFYALKEGTWAYSNIEIEVDGCTLSRQARQDGIQSMLDVRYSVQYVAANNYRFTLELDENSSVDFVCLLEENELSCDALTLETPAYDSIVVERYLSAGTLSSDTRVEGIINKTHTCEGPECGAIELGTGLSFPCEIQFSYTFNYFD